MFIFKAILFLSGNLKQKAVKQALFAERDRADPPPGPAAPAAPAGPAGTRNAARLPWNPPLPLVRGLSSVPGDGRAVAGRSPPGAGTRAAQGRKRQRLPHQGARIPLLLHRGRCAYLLR